MTVICKGNITGESKSLSEIVFNYYLDAYSTISWFLSIGLVLYCLFNIVFENKNVPRTEWRYQRGNQNPQSKNDRQYSGQSKKG